MIRRLPLSGPLRRATAARLSRPTTCATSKATRRTRPTTNWTVEDNVWSSGALQATITGLTNGTRYDVQARAVNAIGNGTWSATVSGKAATVPSAPYLWSARASNGQIYIVWSGPDSDGGSDITSYDLRYIRSDADDSVDANWTLQEDFSQVASAYRILGLTNGVAYHMQVRAINAAGDGAWSERVTRTPVGPPGTPSIDTVTPGDESLTIMWSPPSSDGGAAITSYNLRYVRNDLTSAYLFLWTYENGIWTSGDLEYTLSGLDNGVRYRLGLQAVNSESSSEWSDWNDPRTGIAGEPPEVPGAPTNIKAYSNGTTVDIKWSAPADDGGADITSYDLRYISSDATDKADDDNWTVLEGVWTSGALKYTVEGLTANVQYDFQLRAVNSAGAGSWSATVNNMDPSPPGAPVIGLFSEETPGQIWVSWALPADDGGAPVTHYDLRHIRSDAADKADANWTQVDDLSGDFPHDCRPDERRPIRRAGAGGQPRRRRLLVRRLDRIAQGGEAQPPRQHLGDPGRRHAHGQMVQPPRSNRGSPWPATRWATYGRTIRGTTTSTIGRPATSSRPKPWNMPSPDCKTASSTR